MEMKTYNIIPPPSPGEGHLTAELLKKYAVGKVFVETGTYFGQGVESAIVSCKFDKIYSVELDKDLADRSSEIFGDKAKIICGDSPEIIKWVATTFHPPKEVATFWLDAHASGPLPGGAYGNCPVVDELKMIRDFWDKNSTIMIDDCRLFGSNEWGGVTKEQALEVLKEINPDYTIEYVDGEISNDVLVAYAS